MTPLLSDQNQRRQVELDATSTSASTLARTTALAMLFLVSQPSAAALIVTADRRFAGLRTIGSGAEILSLRITDADMFNQINRVYDELLTHQVDLDMDVKRTIYGQLWDLYS